MGAETVYFSLKSVKAAALQRCYQMFFPALRRQTSRRATNNVGRHSFSVSSVEITLHTSILLRFPPPPTPHLKTNKLFLCKFVLKTSVKLGGVGYCFCPHHCCLLHGATLTILFHCFCVLSEGSLQKPSWVTRGHHAF